MHNVSLNGEILNKVSLSDFDKLVSVPKATEDSQVKFKEDDDLDAILKEFGY